MPTPHTPCTHPPTAHTPYHTHLIYTHKSPCHTLAILNSAMHTTHFTIHYAHLSHPLYTPHPLYTSSHTLHTPSHTLHTPLHTHWKTLYTHTHFTRGNHFKLKSRSLPHHNFRLNFFSERVVGLLLFSYVI